jgi:FAD/FMN-containing dehydrogenase
MSQATRRKGETVIIRAALIEDLKRLIGEDKVLSDEIDLLCYSFDSSFMAKLNRFLPDVVVTPLSTEDVMKVVRYAYEHEIPVIPRGAGTGETCGAVALSGGIVMDLSLWDNIIEVDAANMQALVRPGVIHARLNEHLARFDLFFPPDPGSTRMCTIGGMVANNASGLKAVKYGSTEQYVLGPACPPYGARHKLPAICRCAWDTTRYDSNIEASGEVLGHSNKVAKGSGDRNHHRIPCESN